MSITHVVLFQFKSSVGADVINEVCSRMLALKDNCLHPLSQKPYIKSSFGGLDNSIEGLQNNISHAFIVQFDSAADRDYYVRDDPVHQEFVRGLDGILEKAQVIDFTNEVI
ncbi:stress responsive A/B barrel domain protein [Penicillium cataractarum]|uniref:Stress responsive A/B barrel domain protein n=1 Tax=Penicillium cataractarum TaxID=2100454 RepID=A0A9W9RR02_9EURO|nr:stress responsive A/B barrel domain protein [Penicillium cataractarum]KAJ5364566.1 stress responsive A/B barrel domain protein [Penicillium cataractarum]